MVVFYTMAYNAEATLPRTIQSVLTQTEKEWIWYLLDNAAQDSTGKIIRRYAEMDSRIIPLKNEKNLVFTEETSFFNLARKHEDSDWFCFLDADDEYAPNFLTDMLAFSRANELDVAACGYDLINSQTGAIQEQRILPRDLILTDGNDFGHYFPVYHLFMRTNWAKLFSIKTAKKFDFNRIVDLFYGVDTLYTQEMLRNSRRFGILAKSLHRYYIYPKSRSYQWHPERLNADQTLYQMACSYLIDKCGEVSSQNRNFLQRVYSDAVTETVRVLGNSSLSPNDKLWEYQKIATNPITLSTYRQCTNENASRSRTELIIKMLEAGAALGKESDTALRTAVQSLLPHCGQAVSAANAQMFLENTKLLQSLLQDDSDALLNGLLERIRNNDVTQKYDVHKAICSLAADNPLLCEINDDAMFLRKYTKLYWMIWQGDILPALEEMTGLLLENRVDGGIEPFLNLYISISAMLEQVSAFIFGKMQLAQLYFRQSRIPECCNIVYDLKEMSVESLELDALCRKLQNSGR